MTPSELQRKVKTALENLSVPVTKDYSEYNGIYPHVVYREIANTPALCGDNREILFSVVYQVTIVTDDDDYEQLESAVETEMTSLGFIRSSAQDNPESGNFNRVLKFKIAIFKQGGD